MHRYFTWGTAGFTLNEFFLCVISPGPDFQTAVPQAVRFPLT